MRAGGKKKMEDLKIGDKIRTSSTSFSAILGWLDKEPGRMTNFMKLETNLTSSISLTGPGLAKLSLTSMLRMSR